MHRFRLLRTEWILLAALTLLALYLRAWGLSEWALDADDAQHLGLSLERSWLGMFRHIATYDNHPPLWYYVWRLAESVSGSDMSVRLPNLLAGTALVPLGWLMLKRSMGGSAAWCFAIVTGFMPLYVVQSQVLRGYVPMLFLFTLAHLALQYWLAAPSARRLMLYAVAALACMGTEYDGVIMVAALCAATAPRLKGRLLAHWLLANAVAALLAAVLLFIYLTKTFHGIGPEMAQAKNGFADTLPGVFRLLWWSSANLATPYQLSIASSLFAALSMLGMGLMCLSPSLRPWAMFCGLVLVLSMLLSYAQLYPLQDTRHCIHLLFALTLGLAGLCQLCANLLPATFRPVTVITAAALSYAAVNGPVYDPAWHRMAHDEHTLPKDDWRTIITFLNQHTRKGDIIVAPPHAGLPLRFEALRGSLQNATIVQCHYYWDHVSSDMLYECLHMLAQDVPKPEGRIWYVTTRVKNSLQKNQKQWLNDLFGKQTGLGEHYYRGRAISVFLITPEIRARVWKEAP